MVAKTVATYYYYENHFPHEEICTLLGRKWRGVCSLDKREFCIETASGAYIRFLYADSPDALKRLLTLKNAEKLHTGAVYNTRPSMIKKTMEGVTPTMREFVIDIDIDDYGLGVDKTDVWACDKAWPIVAFGMKLLEYILRKHFCFRHFMLV